METIFMLDIETTGIDPATNDLLSIGVLAIQRLEDGFWHPIDSITLYLHSDRKPESEFAKKHMEQAYRVANETQKRDPEWYREQLLGFFGMNLKGFYEKNNKPVFTGMNVTGFDVPFLVAKGILKAQGIETVNGKDEKVGDYHYQMYEMQGALKVAQDVFQFDKHKPVEEAAYALFPEIEMPEGKAHDAMYDCYKQTRVLNGLIRLLRGPK